MKCGSYLFLALICSVASYSFGLSGSGVPGDPFIIGSLADLTIVTSDSAYWDDVLQLDVDLDLTGQPASPTALLGHDFATAFTGTFDGNGHVISNITIDTVGVATDYLGFFGYLGNDAEVTRLGIENITINAGNGCSYIGGMIGFNYAGSGVISQSFVTGSITAGNDCQYVGGFNGYTLSGEIKDSYCRCVIIGGDNSQNVGGFMGYSWNADLTRNYSASQITAGTGSTDVDAFLGSSEHLLQSANFCDVELAGIGTTLEFVGATTLEMYQKPIYQDAAWDFTTKWQMPTRNYPLCGWQPYTIGVAELQRLANDWITTSTDPNIVYPIDYFTDGQIDYKDFARLSKSMGAAALLFGFPEIFDGFETGDFSALNWTTSSDVPWQIAADNPYQGTYAASAGPLANDQSSMLTLNVTTGDSTLEFYLSKSHTNNLFFFIDGGIVGFWNMAHSYQHAEFNLPEGEHTLEWIYQYSFSGTPEGKAHLDNIRIYSEVAE